MKRTPYPGKFERSGNIGSKSAELVEGSDSIVTLTHSEGQHSSLRLRGSKLQKSSRNKQQLQSKFTAAFKFAHGNHI